ncbi:MAG: DUF1512 family protein, partial [Candidatus Aenigmatarchaeota archaeon]
EFFTIEPVSLDPYGLVQKIEHIINAEEEKMKYQIKLITPGLNEERRASIFMGVAGATQVHQISKIIRHFLEQIKRTKNIQLAMILQMQLPLIERIAKAMYKGTSVLARGEPIGDSIGPLIVSKMIGDSKTSEIENDTVIARSKYKGRNVILMKAMGPGGRLGRLGRACEKLLKRESVSRIITIDAAAKLEGEVTGGVAEGVGVAIGGPGVDKSYIENLAVKRNMPLDSIIVKMGQEEAIMAMPSAVKNSYNEVLKALDRVIERTRKSDKLLIVGVGNTSGIGNSKKEIERAEKLIDASSKRAEAEKKKRHKERGILKKLLGEEEEEF